MTWPNVFEGLLSSDFMPHGHRYLWRPGLVALHAVSDGLVALAALHGSRDAFLLVRAVRDGEAVVDFTVVDCNERGALLLGVTRGRRISEALAADDGRELLARWSAAGGAGVTRKEVAFRAQPGATFEEQLVPVEDGFAVAIHDVSERARAENLRARLAAIVESSDDAIFSLGTSGRIETWNAGAERLFGWTREEIIGQPAALLEIDAHPARAEAVRRKKDGSSVDVALVVSAIHDPAGAITGHAVIARDVSAQKRAERQVKASLREKDVLLTEVHHRVKNNLQVICSLLSLQAAKVEDGRALEMFQESQDRVRSIAVFHEHLYQSQDLARIDIGAYVRTLVTSLIATYGADRRVRVEVDADDVRLGVDKAIPCGLLVNELVSNALKHAFPDGRSGQVRVGLHLDARAGRSDLVLTVEDDGVGLPATLEVGRAATLGHQLVVTLARQLGGSVSLDRTRGARFTITFSRGNAGGPVEPRREARDGVDPHR